MSPCVSSRKCPHEMSFQTDVAEGIKYLHSRRPVMIHRDIKTHNLLISDDGRVGGARVEGGGEEDLHCRQLPFSPTKVLPNTSSPSSWWLLLSRICPPPPSGETV